MTKTLAIILAALSATAISLVGFVLTGGSPFPDLKWAFIVLYVAATGAIFFTAARALAVDQLAASAVAAALGSLFVEQLLAFGWFPGLAKDVTPLTFSHSRLLVDAVAAAIAWYMFIAGFAYVVGRQNRFWIAVLVTVAWEALFIFGITEECLDCAPDGYHFSFAAGPLWLYLVGPVVGISIAMLASWSDSRVRLRGTDA